MGMEGCGEDFLTLNSWSIVSETRKQRIMVLSDMMIRLDS